MVGIQTLVESLLTVAPNIVTLQAATKLDVLPSRKGSGRQFVYRQIQNNTGADLYVAVDTDADNVDNYHAILANRGTFNNISNGRVSCYSVAGGQVITLEQERAINSDPVPNPSDA